jgi:outer membrane cobalamin receptor
MSGARNYLTTKDPKAYSARRKSRAAAKSKAPVAEDNDLFAEEFSFGEIKVISATKTAQSVEDAPASIYVITKEEMQAYGWSSIDDILNYIPGVESQITAGSDRLYNFRGIGSSFNSRILFMIDGISVADAFHGGSSRSAKSFAFANIDRIEVIRGPGSALYGTGAFSGIVNIITRKAEKNGLGLKACGGNGGALGSCAYVSMANEKFGVRVYGTYKKDDGFQRPYDAYNTDKYDIIDPQGMVYFGGVAHLHKWLQLHYNYGKHTRVNGIGLNFPHAAQDMEVYGEYENISLTGDFPIGEKIEFHGLVFHRKANWIGEGDVLSPEDMAVHPKFKNAYAAGKFPNGGFFQPLRGSSLNGTDLFCTI